MSGLRKFQYAEESLYFHLSLLQTKQMTAHHLKMYPSNKNRLNEANKRLKKEKKKKKMNIRDMSSDPLTYLTPEIEYPIRVKNSPGK